jgi:hypothetical protein
VGYAAGRHKIETDEHEEQDITGFIVCGINDWMRSRARLPWCKYFDVHEEAPLSKEGSQGKSRPRTDILVKWCSRPERPEYIFEAKRLRARGYGVGRYTGLEGMGCFTEGIYALGYDEAAMLGYVQSDLLSQWKERIKQSIINKAASLYLTSPQYDEAVIADFPLEWVVNMNGKKTQTALSKYIMFFLIVRHQFNRSQLFEAYQPVRCAPQRCRLYRNFISTHDHRDMHHERGSDIAPGPLPVEQGEQYRADREPGRPTKPHHQLVLVSVAKWESLHKRLERIANDSFARFDALMASFPCEYVY